MGLDTTSDHSDLIFKCPETGDMVEIDRDELETETCYHHGADGAVMVCCSSCLSSHPLAEMKAQGL